MKKGRSERSVEMLGVDYRHGAQVPRNSAGMRKGPGWARALVMGESSCSESHMAGSSGRTIDLIVETAEVGVNGRHGEHEIRNFGISDYVAMLLRGDRRDGRIEEFQRTGIRRAGVIAVGPASCH